MLRCHAAFQNIQTMTHLNDGLLIFRSNIRASAWVLDAWFDVAKHLQIANADTNKNNSKIWCLDVLRNNNKVISR
jgi:hypothetical protein